MIRRSTAIATVAVLLSLIVHLLGLSFSSSLQPQQPIELTATDVVAVGNAFEDVAEATSEPVEPDTATAPEPPAETSPQPDISDIPTTEALVASEKPQPTVAPDAGTAKIVQPEKARPPEPEQSAALQPETIVPSVIDSAANSPNESDGAEPAESPPIAQAPQSEAPSQIAALQVPITAITPATESPAVPVIPLIRETIEPEILEAAVEPASEKSEKTGTKEDLGGSDLAVTSSLRPQLPSRQSFVDTEQELEDSTEPSDGRPSSSQLIESPLVAYQRDGTDLLATQKNGAVSDGLGNLDSRSPGNSDVTNYAGRVLMQLNRTPTVRISVRGFARVHFEINPDGTLARVNIIDGTGSLEINNAAKAQVRNAAPFPRPPKGASRKLTFVYRIN
ncbi:MAG: TonB family protein [Paracoccaceae bacterium]